MIIGLGQTGYSCARYFHARGLPFEVMDESPSPPLLARLRSEMPEVPVTLGRLDVESMGGAAQLVVSPGVPLAAEQIRAAREAGVPVTGDIDLFSRATDLPIIAVTGSNGKSSVTCLVGEIARACGKRAGVGGNLGPPALDLLDGNEELFVLEVSSFQLETTARLGARVAALLNLTPDHMDRYDDADQYYAAKAKIFAGCRDAVVGSTSLELAQLPAGVTPWVFGEEPPRGDREFGLIESEEGAYLCRGERRLVRADELVVKGRHNQLNALAALAIAAAVDWPEDSALEAVRRFAGLPHRCEWVADCEGVTYVNDSKGTNVGATLAALESFGRDVGRRIVLIAGGAHKGADFTLLAAPVRQFVKAAVLIGQEAATIARALEGLTQIRRAADLNDAVAVARNLAEPGDVVLLSPACSSLDMFRNFEERGDRFRQAVGALRDERGGSR